MRKIHQWLLAYPSALQEDVYCLKGYISFAIISQYQAEVIDGDGKQWKLRHTGLVS